MDVPVENLSGSSFPGKFKHNQSRADSNVAASYKLQWNREWILMSKKNWNSIVPCSRWIGSIVPWEQREQAQFDGWWNLRKKVYRKRLWASLPFGPWLEYRPSQWHWQPQELSGLSWARGGGGGSHFRPKFEASDLIAPLHSACSFSAPSLLQCEMCFARSNIWVFLSLPMRHSPVGLNFYFFSFIQLIKSIIKI